MPEIDGYELCKTIKGNTNTKHVPVILITSDLSAEAKIKGFQSGLMHFYLNLSVFKNYSSGWIIFLKIRMYCVLTTPISINYP